MNRTINRTSRQLAGWMSTAVVSLLAVLSLAACSSGTPSTSGPADQSPATSAPGSSAPGSSAPASSAPASSAPASSAADSNATLKVADSSLGRIVVDAQGRTAYIFTADKPGSGRSACTGECLAAWPPITTKSSKVAAEGITGELGTIKAAGGKRQVTLNGYPLYRFTPDTAPGEVKGQGVKGVWYVVSADGSKITSTPSSGGGY